MIKLNLIVLRTPTPLEAAQWYSKVFGLEFVPENHDGGTLHYSAKISEGVLEIYPTSKTASKITFGFAVNKSDFEEIAVRVNPKIIGENIVLIKDADGNSIILSLSE